MRSSLALVAAATIVTSPAHSQGQWELALPTHIAAAVNCIMTQWEQNPDSFTLTSSDIIGTLVMHKNWEQSLVVDASWKTYIDIQTPLDETYFDWVSDISIDTSWQGGIWWYDMTQELNTLTLPCRIW